MHVYVEEGVSQRYRFAQQLAGVRFPHNQPVELMVDGLEVVPNGDREESTEGSCVLYFCDADIWPVERLDGQGGTELRTIRDSTPVDVVGWEVMEVGKGGMFELRGVTARMNGRLVVDLARARLEPCALEEDDFEVVEVVLGPI